MKMNNNNNNELEQDSSSNKCIIELSSPLAANELDFLTLYLESRKQSGGGDIQKVLLNEDSTQMTVFYEDKEAQQRILEKKYLQFRNYQLRASLTSGLINDSYPVKSNEIILVASCVCDKFLMESYAENLLPNNQVERMQTLANLSNRTFLVTYTNEIDRELLMDRFSKRLAKMKLFESFRTNTFIIRSSNQNAPITSTQMITLRQEIESKLTKINISFFFKTFKKNQLLCQTQTETDLTQLIGEYLSTNGYLCEYCFNFELLSLNLTVSFDKSIQTDDEQVQMNQSSLNSLSNTNELELNSKDTHVDALLNSRQLYINFEELLKKLDKNLTMKIMNGGNRLLIRNSFESATSTGSAWKSKVTNELKKFFTTKALHRIIKIPNEIQSNKQSMDMLRQHLSKTNKSFPALYLRLDGQTEISCHGTRNALINKLEQFPDLFKSFLATSSSSLASASSSSSSYKVTTPIEQETSSQQKNGSTQQEKMIELDSGCLTSQALVNIPQIFFDFRNSLKDYNAELIKDEARKKIQIRCNLNSPGADDTLAWSNRIKCLIDDYEKNRLRSKKTIIPVQLRRQKELDDLRKHCEHFYGKEKTLRFEIKSNEHITGYGYAAQVKTFTDNILSKFGNLENNIKDRIRRKLDVKLEPNRIGMLSVLTDLPNGSYFTQFNSELNKLEAIAELIIPPPQQHQKNANHHNGISIRIKCLMSPNKQTNEQTVEQWRNKIDSFVLNFFSMFSLKRQKVSFRKGEFNLDEITGRTGVKTIWIDVDTIELSGMKKDIDKITADLANLSLNNANSKLVGSRRQSSATSNKENSVPFTSSDTVTNESSKKKAGQETFIISDLKWFQTRMLFEKKYFLFITETFKDLNVLVDTQLTRIYFTGTKSDIEEAKKLALNILDNILGTEIESNEKHNEKLIENEPNLVNLFKQKGICSIIDAKSYTDKYTIYATSYEEIEQCRALLLSLTF